MKSLLEFITPINEANAANLQNPRKGSSVYILKDGDNAAIQVKIAEVSRLKLKGFTRIQITLEKNPYDVNFWEEYVYDGVSYEVEKYQCKTFSHNGDDLYIGTSPEAIEEFISIKAGVELRIINQQIEDTQQKLDALYKKKQEKEAKIVKKLDK